MDIVKEGIRAAAGEELSRRQEDVVLRGHAIECRINAEDASKNFAPAPGKIGAYSEPKGPGVRVDSGVGAGGEVSPMYDPMVAKLIVWDADREQATRRMLRALDEYEIEGLKTLIPFHKALLATEQWAKGETCRDLLEDRAVAEDARVREARSAGRRRRSEQAKVEQAYTVEVSGQALRREGHRARRLRRCGGGGALNGSAPARRPPSAPPGRANPRAPAVRTCSSPRCRGTCGRCSSNRVTPWPRARSCASSRR